MFSFVRFVNITNTAAIFFYFIFEEIFTYKLNFTGHYFFNLFVRWRKEILSICAPHYRNQINWSRLHSSQWQINPYEVARAFIPRAHRLYYKSADFHEDFRFTLSFIENTREIPVPKGLREKLWQCRGRVKRKNLRMRMSDEELQGTIEALTEFVSLPVFGDSESLVAKINSLLNSHENDDGCSIM